MNKNSLSNLIDSTSSSLIFEHLLNHLKKVRAENPEQFINAVVTYARTCAGDGNEKDLKYLLYRLDLTFEEEVLRLEHILAIATAEDFPAIVSFFQNGLLSLAERGKRVSTVFLKLEDSVRRDALHKIKFSDEEIKWLCSQFVDHKFMNVEEMQTHHLYLSIERKVSAWKMIGLMPYTQQKSILANSTESVISEYEKDTTKPNEIEESIEKLIETIRSRNILTNQKLKNLFLDRKKAGRRKAFLVKETGEIKGSLGAETHKILDFWNDRKSIEDIALLCFPKARTPISKKSAIKKIKRKLNTNSHLLIFPYDGK